MSSGPGSGSCSRDGDPRHVRPREAVGMSQATDLVTVVSTVQSPTVQVRALAAACAPGVVLVVGDERGPASYDVEGCELVGLPALVMQLWTGLEPCYHSACDGWRRLERRSLRRAQRVAEAVLRRP